MIYKTILTVEKGKKGKVWGITRCDNDPGVVGEITGYGIPRRASDLPLGSTFETIFKIKE